jgi:hypothetical protein
MREDGGSTHAADSDGYRDDSDGYQDDRDGNSTDSDQSRADSDGYPGDSDGDPSAVEEVASKPAVDDEPFWARLGYASFDEYLAGFQASQDRFYNDAPARRSLPDPDVVGEEAGDVGAPAPRSRARDHAVGIRLSDRDYWLLSESAELYGVAPSTLARMLVRRGAQAILDRERGEGEGEPG